MHTITLTSEEKQMLEDVLQCSVSDLRSQIVHTDHYNFKKMLKNRKQLIQKILDSLKKPSIAA